MWLNAKKLIDQPMSLFCCYLNSQLLVLQEPAPKLIEPAPTSKRQVSVQYYYFHDFLLWLFSYYFDRKPAKLTPLFTLNSAGKFSLKISSSLIFMTLQNFHFVFIYFFVKQYYQIGVFRNFVFHRFLTKNVTYVNNQLKILKIKCRLIDVNLDNY